jgi:prepilin-type N-terminal cleavage/methylation domain-containing protein
MNIFKNKNGFSLIELMLSMVILIIIFAGLLYTYIACFELNETARSLTLANNALQAQMESIKEVPFVNLDALDQDTFTLNGFSANSAIGLIDVWSSPYGDCRYIRLVACWRQRAGRVIGEDINLDGIIQDPPEDIDDDGVIDSPAELITLISRIN